MYYIDANVLIGVVEAGLGGAQLSRFILDPSEETHPLITSEITAKFLWVR